MTDMQRANQSHPGGLRRSSSPRGGVTLMESLIASAILLVIVTAVASAIVAGQHQAHEAQQHIAGVVAAEEMMGRLLTVPYENLEYDWDGYEEDVGSMTILGGTVMPPTYARIGRRVSVEEVMEVVTRDSVRIRGKLVSVETFDAEDHTLVALRMFIPEPQAATLPGFDPADLGEDDATGFVAKLLDPLIRDYESSDYDGLLSNLASALLGGSN